MCSPKPILMKKPLIGLLVICVSVISCSKHIEPPQSISQNALSADSNFISIVHQEKLLTQFILNLAKERYLTPIELKNKLQSLHDKDVNSNSGDRGLNEYLGDSNLYYLSNYVKAYKKNWTLLNNKYAYISMQHIDTAVKQLYAYRYNTESLSNSTVNNIKGNMYTEIEKTNDCGWRYTLCIAEATAAAIICHAGCVGSTAGLGTPICVLLCGTIQTAAGVYCIDNYCPLP